LRKRVAGQVEQPVKLVVKVPVPEEEKIYTITKVKEVTGADGFLTNVTQIYEKNSKTKQETLKKVFDAKNVTTFEEDGTTVVKPRDHTVKATKSQQVSGSTHTGKEKDSTTENRAVYNPAMVLLDADKYQTAEQVELERSQKMIADKETQKKAEEKRKEKLQRQKEKSAQDSKKLPQKTPEQIANEKRALQAEAASKSKLARKKSDADKHAAEEAKAKLVTAVTKPKEAPRAGKKAAIQLAKKQVNNNWNTYLLFFVLLCILASALGYFLYF